MVDSYNGCAISLNITNQNTAYGNGYDYISWPDSTDSINNYIDDSIEIYEAYIQEDQFGIEKDFSGEVVVLYNDYIKEQIYNGRFRYGDFYIQVLNKNFGQNLDSNKNIIHTTLKGKPVSDVNTDTYTQLSYEKDDKNKLVEVSKVVNNYNQINWIIRYADNVINNPNPNYTDQDADNCDFILRNIPIFIPSDDFKTNKPVITLGDIDNSKVDSSSININIKYDDTDYTFTLNHNLQTGEFTISNNSGINYNQEYKYITLANKKIYFDNFVKLLFVNQTVCSIPYSDFDDYLENSSNNIYKKIVTKNKYDNLLVSLNNSNTSEKLESSDGLFHFYLMCDSWNKYHEFCPIDKLSILKKGLYSFRCYDDQTEVPGTINILTFDKQCKLLDNNILVGTNTQINLSDFSEDYSNYESWMDQQSKQNLIEIKIENLQSYLKQWLDPNNWLEWDNADRTDKPSKCPLPKDIDNEIKIYYNKVNSDLLIDNSEIRKYDADWNTINKISNFQGGGGSDEEEEEEPKEPVVDRSDWRSAGPITLQIDSLGDDSWRSIKVIKIEGKSVSVDVGAYTQLGTFIVNIRCEFSPTTYSYIQFWLDPFNVSVGKPSDNPVPTWGSSTYTSGDFRNTISSVKAYINDSDKLCIELSDFWYDYTSMNPPTNTYSLKSNNYSLRSTTVDSSDYAYANFYAYIGDDPDFKLGENLWPSKTWTFIDDYTIPNIEQTYTANITVSEKDAIRHASYDITTQIADNTYSYSFEFEAKNVSINPTSSYHQLVPVDILIKRNGVEINEYSTTIEVRSDNMYTVIDNIKILFPEPAYELYSDKISRINNVSFLCYKNYDKSDETYVIYEGTLDINEEISLNIFCDITTRDNSVYIEVYDSVTDELFFYCEGELLNKQIVEVKYFQAYYNNIMLSIDTIDGVSDEVRCTLSSIDLPYPGLSYEGPEIEEPEEPEEPENLTWGLKLNNISLSKTERPGFFELPATKHPQLNIQMEAEAFFYEDYDKTTNTDIPTYDVTFTIFGAPEDIPTTLTFKYNCLNNSYTIQEGTDPGQIIITATENYININIEYFYTDFNINWVLQNLYKSINNKQIFLIKDDQNYKTSGNFYIDDTKHIKTELTLSKNSIEFIFKDNNNVVLNRLSGTINNFEETGFKEIIQLTDSSLFKYPCELNFVPNSDFGGADVTFSKLLIKTQEDISSDTPEQEETILTKDVMLEYLNVAVQRVIQDLKVKINETQAGENYTRIKNLDNTVDLKNDWIGNIKFIPDDPIYFKNNKNNNLTLSIIYKENLDDFNNINYYNSKNEYISCNYVKNYYLGSKDYSLKTFIDDGILFSFSADYKSPYYVKGRYRELTCHEMFPIVYNVSTSTTTNGSTATVNGLFLNDEYNFNSSKHFKHVSGICQQEIFGKNAQIFIVRYDNNGLKYVYGTYSEREVDKERDVGIHEQNVVSGFKTNNDTLYLIPTFLYKTGKDNLAKSSVNANGYTVSVVNEPYDFTSRLTSLGYLESGKVYPGSLWNREISEWEGLYLGLLSNLYFSYTTSSYAPYNINYAGYKKYETSFTKDILVSISPRSLDDCNKYITIRDANYVDWIKELTKYRSGNINQDLNVNLQLEGAIKNFPMTFNFEYKLPVIDMTEPKSDDTVIHSIYGDTITKIKDLKSDIIYTLDGNGNPINVNNYPYIPKCDINQFVISSNNIKYKGKPTTMVCIQDLTSRGLTKSNNYIKITNYNNQGTYSILTTQRRNWRGKKFDEHLTGLPNNADFIE